MALTSVTVIDQVTILEDGVILVREAKRIFEDGVQISERFNRTLLEPGQDVLKQPNRLQRICNIVWTAQVIADFQAAKAARLTAALIGPPPVI